MTSFELRWTNKLKNANSDRTLGTVALLSPVTIDEELHNALTRLARGFIKASQMRIGDLMKDLMRPIAHINHRAWKCPKVDFKLGFVGFFGEPEMVHISGCLSDDLGF